VGLSTRDHENYGAPTHPSIFTSPSVSLADAAPFVPAFAAAPSDADFVSCVVVLPPPLRRGLAPDSSAVAFSRASRSRSISAASATISPVPIFANCDRCWSRAVRRASHAQRCLFSSNLRICSSGGIEIGAGAGVATRSGATGVGAGAGTGAGGVGVGAGESAGCACAFSGALLDDPDPGFAGRDGWRGLPEAGVDVEVELAGLVDSAAFSCVLVGVEADVAAALARAAAMRSI